MWAGVRQGVSTGSAVAAEAVAVVCFSLFVTRWPRAATLWKQKLVLRLDLGQRPPVPLCPCGFPPGREHQGLLPLRERRGCAPRPRLRSGQVQGSTADPPPLVLSAPTPGSLCSASPSPPPLRAGCGQEARASSEVGTCLLSSCFVPLP